MNEPVKLEFKTYPNGTWEDWTKYIITLPTCSLNIESELPEKHGVIVLDDAKITLKYLPNTPVSNLIPNSFVFGKFYLLRISYYCEGAYYQRYEGIIDIGSISYPDEISVQFKIKDKLAALNLIQNTELRTKTGTLWTRFKSAAQWFNFITKSKNTIQFYIGSSEALGDATSLPAVNFTAGEVIELPTTDGKTGLIFIQKVTYWDVTATLTIIPEEGKKFDPNISIRQAGTDKYKLYSKEILGKDLYLYDDNNVPQAINGIALVKEFIKTAWPDELIINKSGYSTFPIPLLLFKKFITKPLEKNSMEFLEMLAKKLKSHLFFNRFGYFVIQNRTKNKVVREIGKTIVDNDLGKKEFHKPPVDAVSVKLTTHLVDKDGQNVFGEAIVKKQNNFEPRNILKIESFIINTKTSTKDQADEEARVMANEELNYYGLKRSSHPLKLHLDKNTIQWELTDLLFIKGVKYLFTNIKISFKENRVYLTPVEESGKNFDSRQVFQPRRNHNNSEVKNVTIYQPIPKKPLENVKIIEVDELKVTPVDHPHEGNTPYNPLMMIFGDNVNRSIYTYSGAGNIKLQWKHIIGGEGDAEGKFRFVINTEKEMWQNVKRYVCRAVRVTKEELLECKEYEIRMRIKNKPNEYYKSNNCFPTESDFDKWGVLDRIPVNNLKYGSTVEYPIPSQAFLNKYIDFWVGLVIPKEKMKNTYYKFTDFTISEKIVKVSSNAPLLPPAYNTGPEWKDVFQINKQWKEIITKRVGSGFLSMLNVKFVGDPSAKTISSGITSSFGQYIDKGKHVNQTDIMIANKGIISPIDYPGLRSIGETTISSEMIKVMRIKEIE